MKSLSFKFRFIISFVLVEVFFILLIVGVNFFSINNTTKKLIKKEIQTTKHLLNSLATLPISVYDLATLDDIATQSTIGNLNSIVIFDSNQRLLSKNYNINTNYDEFKDIEYDKDYEIIENSNKFIVTKTKIIEDDLNLGSMILVYDLNEITTDINKNKQNTFFIILIEILISSIIAYLIGRNLTNQLTRLSLTAQKIGNDEKVDFKYDTSNNELALLNNSLSKMYDDINFRNEKLKEAKIVFDNITEAIIVLDRNKNIINANESFYKITQFQINEIQNKNLFKLLDINIDDFEENIENNVKAELKIKTKNSDILNVILNINIIKDERQKIKNYIVLFVDTTKEKRKEELLQVQSKMATMGEMIGNIAHQWRQPLSAITSISSSAILQNQLNILDSNEIDKSFNNIIKSSKFLSETIEDFRNFFKADKSIIEFNLNEVLDSLDKIIFTTYKSSNINIEINKPEKDINLIGLKNELLQALLNIFNNAKDILNEKDIKNKLIKVNIEDLENTIQIKIEDNAGGIKEDILPKIFEPYFTTKHQSQGTGIGLYMTHTIITKHYNGSLVATNSNEGAVFIIQIPKNINTI